MAGPVGTFFTGKGSRITISGINLRKSDWDVDYHGDKLDTTNFESAGFAQATIGILEADWNGKGLWNSAQVEQITDPPGIFPRDNLGQANLYLSVSSALSWSFPQSLVVSAKNSSAVRDLVKFEWSSFSNGSFTAPAG